MVSPTERTILVTGATGDIGSSIVRRLCHDGFRVIAGGRSARSVQEISATTGAIPLVFDVTDEVSVRQAVSSQEIWGLVNCAGVGGEFSIPQEANLDVLDELVRVNLRGPVLVTKYATRTMISHNRGGSIVNVSSLAAISALQGLSTYSASKAALDGLTRAWASELGKFDIRVNSVNPTVVMNRMAQSHWGRSEIAEPFLNATPLRRWATEEDVAGPIAFLLSDDSAMISGVTLPIDGGYSAR
ncbi:SDR family oxidoreductase [Homoserinimonas sp. OAct 916]|uniref:SDR family oxidoreductase n=1 Tax=Homoserinimonas sp. OAct 916 TaxID=2211450 RepID=UPI0018E5420F|nr:SDR family oxidoreductase [Homoserinimonas sp. OAct 916]